MELVKCGTCGDDKPKNTSIQYGKGLYECHKCMTERLDKFQKEMEYWRGQVYA